MEFVAADIYDIPGDKQGPYDIVLTTAGVIGWMPNLEEFLDVLARLTRPGGHVFIEEIHPVLLMHEEDEGDAPPYLAYSYFKEEPYVETSGLDYYQGKKYSAKAAYSFHHTLSDIMMAAPASPSSTSPSSVSTSASCTRIFSTSRPSRRWA